MCLFVFIIPLLNFCNVCFLRKEIKMYLDFKEKAYPISISFTEALWKRPDGYLRHLFSVNTLLLYFL